MVQTTVTSVSWAEAVATEIKPGGTVSASGAITGSAAGSVEVGVSVGAGATGVDSVVGAGATGVGSVVGRA